MDEKKEAKRAIPEVFYQLDEIRQALAKINIELLQRQVHTHLEEEAQELLEYYKKEIEPLDKADPLKIEVLTLLIELGIDPQAQTILPTPTDNND